MKKAVSIIIFIFFAFVAFSQSERSLLWKISGNGIRQPSYLFGTMHILCAEDAKLSDSLKSVIGRCDEVYFEIDMTDMAGMMAAMQYMRMRDDKKISDLLSAADYEKLKKYFEMHPSMLPFSMLERFKPMLISSLMEESQFPCATTNGMEWVLMKEAKADNKKINGLETAAFQASLFDSIPYEDQAKDLMKYIDSGEQYKKISDTLREAYIKQDLQQIESLTQENSSEYGHFMDLLLYDRNRRWVGIMQKLIPNKSLLFAVGAGHLPGNKGLINLLREKGYTITAVKNH
ncbi:MAG: TraB/GumN family protein [Bacteroidetes bacterium]|nr:TraB/GumN family protein [Bacteroidota bacterium]